jgi:hypothetical protein
VQNLDGNDGPVTEATRCAVLTILKYTIRSTNPDNREREREHEQEEEHPEHFFAVLARRNIDGPAAMIRQEFRSFDQHFACIVQTS